MQVSGAVLYEVDAGDVWKGVRIDSPDLINRSGIGGSKRGNTTIQIDLRSFLDKLEGGMKRDADAEEGKEGAYVCKRESSAGAMVGIRELRLPWSASHPRTAEFTTLAVGCYVSAAPSQ